MEDTTIQEMLKRLRMATNSPSDAALATPLKISPSAVADAIKRHKIPDRWVRLIARKYGVSADWLYFGRGSMHFDEDVADSPEPKRGWVRQQCAQCVKLEKKLEDAEIERKNLAADVKRLNMEKDFLYQTQEKLLRENGDLREKLARLEERNRMEGEIPAPMLGETQSA